MHTVLNGKNYLSTFPSTARFITLNDSFICKDTVVLPTYSNKTQEIPADGSDNIHALWLANL